MLFSVIKKIDKIQEINEKSIKRLLFLRIGIYSFASAVLKLRILRLITVFLNTSILVFM
ncbi:hypothetical protein EMQU_2326 [Enterococcus mundtii QU 25]|uniref:Uncharacterized protein n=1 Tax=Enterococcus mundtii TaxID=53346 RepID=A0AAI8R877_ENTMU|nr:hypothetical protein EMQU_2326 [Enterococcus mundtii QU 25]BBM14210.1 uncharacterized protein EM151A_0972 [Enterococcus mundtii]